MIRLGVVSICISITVYHGYGCTEKFVSNPATVNDETVPLNELPPLQWSICKQFVVKACRVIPMVTSGGRFTENIEYVCFLEDGEIPNHSNTTSLYWEQLQEKKERYGIIEFIKEIDIWNRSSFTWEPTYYLSYANGSEMMNNRNLFR